MENQLATSRSMGFPSKTNERSTDRPTDRIRAEADPKCVAHSLSLSPLVVMNLDERPIPILLIKKVNMNLKTFSFLFLLLSYVFDFSEEGTAHFLCDGRAIHCL